VRVELEIELHESLPESLVQMIADMARLSSDPQDCARSIVQIAIAVAQQMPLQQRILFSAFLRSEASWVELKEQ
jgi:hypothetical protein